MINIFGFTLLFGFILLLGAAALGVWIWALVDCIRSDRPATEKILWILVIFLFNLLGAILYLLLRGSTQRKSGRMRRSSSNRVITGVCSGIGEYLDCDPTIIRLLWVVVTICSVGTGVLLYLIAAVIMPSDAPSKQRGSSNVLIVCMTAVAIVVIIAIVCIVAIAMTQYRGAEVSGRVTDSSYAAERIVIDNIRSQLGPEAEGPFSCDVRDHACGYDPYESRGDCYQVLCKYESGKIGYRVESIVFDNRIQSSSFTRVTLPDRTIRSVADCRAAGYEVLYPELIGGPIQCATPDGAKDIVADAPERMAPICVDMCGDGVCQEMVCMAEGCPCAETPETCPQDCT